MHDSHQCHCFSVIDVIEYIVEICHTCGAERVTERVHDSRQCRCFSVIDVIEYIVAVDKHSNVAGI